MILYYLPTGHGLSIIVRSSPSWGALLDTSTTTSPVSTLASHVTTPAHVCRCITFVRSFVSVAWTALTSSLAVDVELAPAIPSIVLVSWRSESVILTFVLYAVLVCM